MNHDGGIGGYLGLRSVFQSLQVRTSIGFISLIRCKRSIASGHHLAFLPLFSKPVSGHVGSQRKSKQLEADSRSMAHRNVRLELRDINLLCRSTLGYKTQQILTMWLQRRSKHDNLFYHVEPKLEAQLDEITPGCAAPDLPRDRSSISYPHSNIRLSGGFSGPFQYLARISFANFLIQPTPRVSAVIHSIEQSHSRAGHPIF
jgi:hypothetical protein